MIFWYNTFDIQFNTLLCALIYFKNNHSWTKELLSRCDFSSIIIKIKVFCDNKVPPSTTDAININPITFNVFFLFGYRHPPLLYRADWWPNCWKSVFEREKLWKIYLSLSVTICQCEKLISILYPIIFNRRYTRDANRLMEYSREIHEHVIELWLRFSVIVENSLLWLWDLHEIKRHFLFYSLKQKPEQTLVTSRIFFKYENYLGHFALMS